MIKNILIILVFLLFSFQPILAKEHLRTEFEGTIVRVSNGYERTACYTILFVEEQRKGYVLWDCYNFKIGEKIKIMYSFYTGRIILIDGKEIE